MRILFTGGTGLIGQHFIAQFPDHQYTVLTRSPQQAQAKLGLQVATLTSLEGLPNLNDYDAVINLAGEPIIDKRWTKRQKSIICESRWAITRQLVELFKASENPPGVFLSGSAVGVYGDQGDAVITEEGVSDNPISAQGDFASYLCREWEAIAKQAEPYTRVVLLRTGIVLAAEGGALKKMLLPFKCCLGGKIGDGQQYMPWIHYRDMVAAMEFLLNHAQCRGAFNMVAPTPVRNAEFTATLAAALNRVAVLPAPKFLMRLLLGESSGLLLDSQRVVPQNLTQASFEFGFSQLKPALENLLKN